MTRVHDACLRDAVAHVAAGWSRPATGSRRVGDRGWGTEPRMSA